MSHYLFRSINHLTKYNKGSEKKKSVCPCLMTLSSHLYIVSSRLLLFFSLSLYCIYVFNVRRIVVDFFLRFYSVMISHQLQSAPITGYYDYLSRIHYRVNVTPHEETDSEQTMTETTTATSPVVASAVDDGNTVSATDSSSADNLEQQSLNLNDKEVTIWSSAEVQQWIEEQCQKFELKQATTEKFQMNGTVDIVLKSCAHYLIEDLLFIYVKL